MFCGKCGKENVDGVGFCIHCGSMLKQPSAPEDDLDEHVTIPGKGSSPLHDKLEDDIDKHVTILGKGSSLRYDTLDVSATQEKDPTILSGQYRILKKLGEGGMGVVYLAEDMEMGDRLVAVKVLPDKLAGNVRAVENLRKEATTAINLNHPNIICLHGFHSDGDIKFLVMEYIEGQTLEEKLAKAPQGMLDIDETITIAEKIALALDYSHGCKRPVCHRDLKPSNVMIGTDGEVKLLDFGIAREMKDSYTRITGKQDTAGTLPYMSPEQVRGKKLSVSMDIYALGVVCYECLSGHPPFYTGELTYQILHEEPEVLKGAPPYVNSAVQKALAKDTGDRPGTASELIGLLRAEVFAERKPEGKETAQRKGSGESPVAVAPSDAAQAKEYQELTAEALRVPLEKTVGLGGGVKMEFVLIPSGEFDREDDFAGSVHRVKISRPFYVGKFQVTQEQYKAIRGNNPSHFKGDNLPVDRVNWNDATEFCRKLSQKEGKNYRLPTEAEWEYACRASSQTYFDFGDDGFSMGAYGWYEDNSGDKTHPVGQKRPNAFGLYDMRGNVLEWCNDWYDLCYYSKSPSVDPQGPSSGSYRVLRGGSWDSSPGICCSDYRLWNPPDSRYNHNGFRVVLLDF